MKMKNILEILQDNIIYFKEDVEVKKPLIELAKGIESYIEQNYYEKGFVEWFHAKYTDEASITIDDITYYGDKMSNIMTMDQVYKDWKDNIEDK